MKPTIASTCLRLIALFPVMSGCLLAASDESLFGRWALTIPGDRAGWLEIEQRDGWLDGSILWGGGSVVPLSSVVIESGVLTATRVRDVERRDASGVVVRTQQFTETITAMPDGPDILRLTRTAPRVDGAGFELAGFTGRRIPPLPPAPDLAQVRFGEPVSLFNGRDLSGWRTIESGVDNKWRVEDGVLVNQPEPRVEGRPRPRAANLRTVPEFEDFNLALEVNIPADSNSGVYLRGIYEVQVFDSFGKPLDSHNMGAIYSRITPAVAAEKPAGEWQRFDMTLVDRHVTVVLNGRTIIDNQPLAGCTGGALWSDQFRPGPIFLQGDHGPVSYRNIILRPALKQPRATRPRPASR